MQENNETILSINERIVQFVDYLKLNRYKFSKITGISESVLLNIYKGKNKPNIKLLEKVLNIYPALNSNWLLTGNGNMLSKVSIDEIPPLTKQDSSECKGCIDKERIIAALEKANNGLQEALNAYKLNCKDDSKQTG